MRNKVGDLAIVAPANPAPGVAHNAGRIVTVAAWVQCDDGRFGWRTDPALWTLWGQEIAWSDASLKPLGGPRLLEGEPRDTEVPADRKNAPAAV
jgi:hypothetical protein